MCLQEKKLSPLLLIYAFSLLLSPITILNKKFHNSLFSYNTKLQTISYLHAGHVYYKE